MTIKQLILITALTFFSFNIYSQVEENINPEKTWEKDNRTFGQRLVFGGDIGLSFGTITYIKLAPVIGYQITSRWTAGVGPIYIYEKYKDYKFETSTYGGKAVLSYVVLKSTENDGVIPFGNIILHAENEVINVEPVSLDMLMNVKVGERLWIDNFLIGGGLSQPIAGKFSISVFILWDVTQNQYSPYTNPIFKFGFNF